MQNNQASESFNTTSTCYFFVQDNNKCMLPIVKNHYDVKIVNKFTQIRSVQTYNNPFSKSLQIHYDIPVDPTFCLTNLIVKYQQLTLEGTVKQRQKVKAEYRAAKQKGQTVMMAQNSQCEKSILKIKIGNIEPNQNVTIQFSLIGELSIQKEDYWTLNIPSHVGPRYQRLKDYVKNYFQTLWENQQYAQTFYLQTNSEWSFNIHLVCDQKIVTASSLSHKVKAQVISDYQQRFTLDQDKLPQKDLKFTFATKKPKKASCTVGQDCACLSFYLPNSKQNNFQQYDGQYIFVLDRSGSMSGPRIKSAINALVLFLKSLPQKSKFNIISFGSNFTKLFPKSVQYTNTNIASAIKTIQTYTADMGGTQILSTLKSIYQEQNIAKDQTQRHVIVLTDGQVSNTEEVIQLIKDLHQNLRIRTHMIGVGNGVSIDLIKRGSQYGGGQHTFINKTQQMKKQIIHLLFMITAEQIKQFSINYSQQYFQTSYPLIPQIIKKGKQIKFFLRLKSGHQKSQIQKQIIKLTYFDQASKTQQQMTFNVNYKSYVKQLNKYATYLQIEDLLKQGNNKNDILAIQKSIYAQVLCKKTAYICKIKQTSQTKVNQSYLLKFKNALQGVSQIKAQFGTVYIVTLTGKSVEIDTSMSITVHELKQILQEIEGIPPSQARLIFAGRQIQSDRTLEQYGIQPSSTLHLVLRLRGGDQGGQSAPNVKTNHKKQFKLLIKTDNSSVTIQLFLNKSYELKTIEQIYKQITSKYPQLKNKKFDLWSTKSKEHFQMDKTLNEYQIDHQNNSIESSISHLLLNSQQIIKLMQIQGCWNYDEQLISKLYIEQAFKQALTVYGQDKNRAMTKAVLQFLRQSFPQQNQELGLVYKKIQKYLSQKN